MSIYQSIKADILKMMKEKNELISFCRYVDSNILNKSMAENKEIDDDMVISILKNEKKKIVEELENSIKMNRVETINFLNKQKELIDKYLPTVLDEEESKKQISSIVSEIGITSIRDMGKVMGVIKSKLGSSIDMGIASKIVKSILK